MMKYFVFMKKKQNEKKIFHVAQGHFMNLSVLIVKTLLEVRIIGSFFFFFFN